jgi:uncharacterized protein YbjT (DUF2867 family)
MTAGTAEPAGEMVVLAGATGDLGGRIARAVVARGARVRALLRPGTAPDRKAALTGAGCEVVEVDFADPAALRDACRGAVCVASALNGLREVIVDMQARLLDAAVAAGVPRFIPSDFSLDYTALPPGSNRNFDLRREFRARLDAAPIRATSIFNGGFADMLAGQMPLIVRPLRRVLFWENADRTFALTTKDDTAAFTAAAALDPDAPRDLHIAGSEVSAADLARVMTEVTGRRFGTLRVGSLAGLERFTRLVRTVFPQREAVFPAWQGMQYLQNMFSGLAPSGPTDNARYPGMRWTSARDVLSR